MQGIYLAFTVSGVQVLLVIRIHPGDTTVVALKNDTPFLVVPTSSGYEIQTPNVPLYVKKDNRLVRLTDETLGLVEIPSMPLFFEQPGVLNAFTADPDGTKKFDDAYLLTGKTVYLDHPNGKIKVCFRSIFVAVVRDPSSENCNSPSRNYGFVAGKIQSAYLFKYSYIFIDDVPVVKKLNIGIGDVRVVRNEILKDGSSPLTVELAKLIKQIQPNSKYAKPDLSIMFWMICVSRNVGELYRENGIEHKNSKKKHTAPLRDIEANDNLVRLETLLRTLLLQALLF